MPNKPRNRNSGIIFTQPITPTSYSSHSSPTAQTIAEDYTLSQKSPHLSSSYPQWCCHCPYHHACRIRNSSYGPSTSPLTQHQPTFSHISSPKPSPQANQSRYHGFPAFQPGGLERRRSEFYSDPKHARQLSPIVPSQLGLEPPTRPPGPTRSGKIYRTSQLTLPQPTQTAARHVKSTSSRGSNERPARV